MSWWNQAQKWIGGKTKAAGAGNMFTGVGMGLAAVGTIGQLLGKPARYRASDAFNTSFNQLGDMQRQFMDPTRGLGQFERLSASGPGMGSFLQMSALRGGPASAGMAQYKDMRSQARSGAYDAFTRYRSMLDQQATEIGKVRGQMGMFDSEQRQTSNVNRYLASNQGWGNVGAFGAGMVNMGQMQDAMSYAERLRALSSGGGQGSMSALDKDNRFFQQNAGSLLGWATAPKTKFF
jgi:hypothetical protein